MTGSHRFAADSPDWNAPPRMGPTCLAMSSNWPNSPAPRWKKSIRSCLPVAELRNVTMLSVAPCNIDSNPPPPPAAWVIASKLFPRSSAMSPRWVETRRGRR